MILLLCGLVSLVVLGFMLFYAASETRSSGLEGLAVIGGSLAMLVAIVGLVIYCALVMDYLSAEHKARIMNREYGTHYTQEEVFYASSVIDTVRELDRKRMEINGDILKTK